MDFQLEFENNILTQAYQRWGLRMGVVIMVIFQAAAGAGVSYAYRFHHDLGDETWNSPTGRICFICAVLAAILGCYFGHRYKKKHPLNIFIWVIFTAVFSFVIGSLSHFAVGSFIFVVAASITASLFGVFLLTLLVFKPPREFSLTGAVLSSCVFTLMVVYIFHVKNPLEKVLTLIAGYVTGVSAVAVIVSKINNLIMQDNREGVVHCAISIFVDRLSTIVSKCGGVGNPEI